MFLIAAPLITLSFILLVFYKTIVQFYKNDKLLRKVPGPPPIIFFGNTLDFHGSSTKYINTLCRYKESYGDIIKVYDGPLSHMLLVTDHKFIEFILSSTKLIDKSDQYKYLHNWLGTGLLTSTGQKWKTRRRILTPSFHFSILETFVGVFESVGNVLIKKLEHEVATSSFDIYPLITLCTLDIICEAAMGTSVNAQENTESEYVKSVKAMLQIVVNRTVNPLLNIMYPLTSSYYIERKALKVLHSYTESVIDKKIAELKTKSKNIAVQGDFCIKKRMVFLDMLLQCAVDGKPLSRSDLREEVDTFMFEGHDTTSSAIAFTLYSLAMNPSVQKKAIEEQKEIFGVDLSNANVKTKHLLDMKYLELIIKETLRLYPSVPFLGRTLSEDTHFEGITYPKGLNIMIYLFGCQRDPNYFQNPEIFNPERFEQHNNQLFSYVPFSAGPRNCIGQKFAMLEMKSTISKILRNFELLPPRPERNLQLALETILVSKNGVNLSIRKRT